MIYVEKHIYNLSSSIVFYFGYGGKYEFVKEELESIDCETPTMHQLISTIIR